MINIGNTKPTLSKVLSAFSKAIKDLEQIEADEAARERAAVATIAQAEAERQDALNTAQRAANVKANLRNLIGD